MTPESPTSSEASESGKAASWTIERLVPGGDGMARLADGRIGFASRAFPGDGVRPVRLEVKKNHVRALEWALERPSDGRVEAPCPVAERCGGCDWMGLSRPRQLAEKANLVHQALERTAKLEGVPPVTVESAGEPLGYRRRVRFHVDDEGRVGFFGRGTHSLVPIEHCPVCDPRLDDALRALRKIPRNDLAALSEVELRAADAPPVSILFFSRAARPVSSALRSRLEAQLTAFAVHFDTDPPSATADQVYELPGDVRLLAAPGVFTQINWEVNRAVVAAVLEGARVRNVTTFCDLYAGAGNFALPLLASGFHGVAVEKNRRAISSARRAATLAGLDPGAFVAEDAVKFLREAVRRDERYDLVLLDPPRRGAKEILATVLELAPLRILFCACDPVTLARDLGTLSRAGYAVEELRAFDMFPETHHVETLAWMVRKTAQTP